MLQRTVWTFLIHNIEGQISHTLTFIGRQLQKPLIAPENSMILDCFSFQAFQISGDESEIGMINKFLVQMLNIL